MHKITNLRSGFGFQGAYALAIIALVFACVASAPLSAQGDDEIMLEHLRQHTANGQGDNSFRAVLGLESFIDSYVSPARDYGITGLKSTDALVRVESAKIISWFGDSRHIPMLIETADKEKNPVAKQVLFSLAEKLQLTDAASLAERLLSFTQNEKNKNNFAYLACALGQAPFEGKMTGLNDPRADIRIESAAIIAQFGTLEHVNILLGTAVKESDYQARGKLYLAAYKLQYRCAADTQAVIRKFILDGASGNSRQIFNGPIPREALFFILERAEDLGVSEDVISVLENLKRYADQDNAIAARIEEAIGNIRKRNNNTNTQLFDALKNGTLALRPWMTRVLFKENSATTQSSSCASLIALLSRRAVSQADMLKKAMAQHQILRSENLNPSFEFDKAAANQQLRLPTSGAETLRMDIAPLNWQIKVSKDSGNTVSYASQETVKANSYARCLQIKNSLGKTYLKNDRINFQGPLPAGVEFGLSYKAAEPKKGFIVEDENGISYLAKDTNGYYIESAAGKAKITLKVHLIFADAKHTERVAQISEENPSNANGWAKLSGKFDTYDNSEKIPIQSAELEVIVEGTTSGIFIDDVFVRRSEQEFFHDGPAITAITLPALKILAGEFINLTAQVETNDPVGSTIHGQWLSGGYRLGSAAIALTEPAPGSQATSKAVIRAMVQFTKTGIREVALRVTNSFGLESEKLAQNNIEVLAPKATLGSTYEIQPGEYISGELPLVFTIDDWYTFDGYLSVGKNELYADNTLIAQNPAQPWYYNLDTTRLSEGLHELKVVNYLKRSDPESQFVPIVSNIFTINVRNDINAENPIAVIMLDKTKGQAPLTVGCSGGYSKGDIISYSWNFGDGTIGDSSAPRHLFENNSAYEKNYRVTLRIKDARGKTDSANTTITIEPPPLLKSLNASRTIILSGDSLEFSAEITAFQGDSISYSWQSDQEGKLDRKRTFKTSGSRTGIVIGSRAITDNFTLSVPGTHTITFSASNSYGYQEQITTQVTVLQPDFNLNAEYVKLRIVQDMAFPHWIDLNIQGASLAALIENKFDLTMEFYVNGELWKNPDDNLAKYALKAYPDNPPFVYRLYLGEYIHEFIRTNRQIPPAQIVPVTIQVRCVINGSARYSSQPITIPIDSGKPK